jgi:putative nucleotidyltransferase with HDIG domain
VASPAIRTPITQSWPWLAAAVLPAAAFLWLLSHPAEDPLIRVPQEHFIIVTAVSLVAFAMALLLAIAAVQLAQYRVLFLALGFMVMGGLFSVHGVSTPGFLMTGQVAQYAGRVVGISAYLSLFIPALFFAASYTPIAAALERRLPFWPAGWFVVAIATALGAYATIAVSSTELLATLPFGVKPYSTMMAAGTIGLLLFSAYRQLRAYQSSRLPMQIILVLAFLLLAEAQVAMAVGPLWRLSWWEYHFLMLLSVGLAFWSLMLHRARGQTLREVVEATLELQVKVGVEIEEVDTIAVLVAAVEAKDEITKGHNSRVAGLSVSIGREMGLPSENLRLLARAGLLHDVGKIGVPDAILAKPGALDDEEWKVIKRHPALGVEILSKVASLRREAEIVAAHHERVDGSGYPKGLKGEQIPLEARIVAVADTYDVLVSDRPYRKAFGKIKAIQILREESGTHLYPPAVQALLRVIGEKSEGVSQAA